MPFEKVLHPSIAHIAAPVQAPAAPVAPAPETPAAPVNNAAPPAAPSQPVEPAKEEESQRIRFAALARQERQWQQKQAALDVEYKAKQADIEAAKNLTKLKEEARKNPKLVYDTLGMTFDDLVQAELNTGKAPTADMQVKEVMSEVEKLKAEIAAKDKAYQDEKQQLETKAQLNMLETKKQEMVAQLKGNDKYELVNLNNAHDDVWNRVLKSIDNSVKEHGDFRAVLTYDQAAEQVEKIIEDLYSKNKVAKKFQAAPVVPSVAPVISEQPVNSSPKSPVTPIAQTLTQQNTTRTAAIPSSNRHLSDAELKKQLANQLQKDWGGKKETLVQQYERQQAEQQAKTGA